MDTVGYIGLGAMGGAIAEQIAKSRQIIGFDLDPANVQRLVDEGGQAGASARQLARECDVLLVCLPRSEYVERLLFGEEGIADELRPGQLIGDMTTGDPAIARAIADRLSAQRVDYADAPVAGGPHGARDGKLAIFVGSSEAAAERLTPILATVSERVFHVGGIGTGHTMKLVNNTIASAVRAVTFEAIVMGVKNGIAFEKMTEVLPQASARSYQTEVALPRLAEGRFNANFTVDLMIKDLLLSARLAADSNSPMPIGGLVCNLYQAMANQLGGDADVDRIFQLFEKQAGVTVIAEGD